MNSIRSTRVNNDHINELGLFYPILTVFREESIRYADKQPSYRDAVVLGDDGIEYARFPMEGVGGRFDALTNDSHEISELHIVIHDLRKSTLSEFGFSIKSQLGSASTLLNAGDPTNIIYRVVGKDLTDEDIESINSVKDHLDRMRAILDKGCHFEYHDIGHATFKNNLLFLDGTMPQFIARCLLHSSLPEGTSTIAETVEHVAKENPFGYTGSNLSAFYEHKMKSLLLSAALGMKPATEWTGRYDANGGYLVVRKDGEIVCYHFYNQNDVEDYLFNNTRFERGSRSRHQFGSLYRGEDGSVYIKLNLQIRFKK